MVEGGAEKSPLPPLPFSRAWNVKRHNQFLLERQLEQFKTLSELTEISVSELMRRMFDHCLRADVLNTIVPAMSGHMEISLQR